MCANIDASFYVFLGVVEGINSPTLVAFNDLKDEIALTRLAQWHILTRKRPVLGFGGGKSEWAK